MISLNPRLLFLAVFGFFWMPASANNEIGRDTIELVIQGKHIVILLDNLDELQDLERQSLDSIIRSLNEVLEKLNEEKTFRGDTNIIVDKVGGQSMYIEFNTYDNRDELDLEMSSPRFMSLHVRVEENQDGSDKVHVSFVKDTTKQEEFDELQLDFSFGWNNYLSPGGFPSGEDYELNPSQSRFARFGLIFNIPFKKNKMSPSVRSGLEISYYNFMFDQKYRIEDLGTATNFYEDKENVVRKSKLRATYLGLPVILAFEVDNKKKKRGIHASLGADVAYRIGSKAITKFKENRKEKNGGSFNLEPLQYTLRAEVGYRFLTLTAGYTINPMFVDGAGPELNKIYFGFRI